MKKYEDVEWTTMSGMEAGPMVINLRSGDDEFQISLSVDQAIWLHSILSGAIYARAAPGYLERQADRMRAGERLSATAEGAPDSSPGSRTGLRT